MSVSDDLIEEIEAFAGEGRLVIHDDNPEPDLRPTGKDRPHAFVNHARAVVSLNGDTQESTLVHELLHVKYKWVMGNPAIKAVNEMPDRTHHLYSFLTEGLEHLYVLDEQKRLGHPELVYFKKDSKDILRQLKGIEGERTWKGNGLLYFTYCRKGLTDSRMLRDSWRKALGRQGLLQWAIEVGDEIWDCRESMVDMATIFVREGLVEPEEAVLVYYDVVGVRERIESVM